MAAKGPVLQRALVTLMVRTLRPIARIALRHCMSCVEFEDIARWVFVDVALHDPQLSLPDRGKQLSRRHRHSPIRIVTPSLFITAAHSPR